MADENGALIDVTMVDEDDDYVITQGGLTDNSKGTDFSKSLSGRTADKWEEIYEMYRKHSQAVSFSIRKATSRRANGPGTLEIERYFVCSCEGKHGNGLPQIALNQSRNAAITRCECRAGLRSQLNEDGQWEVLQHITDHNHALTPTQWQQHHRSERRISDAEAETIRALTEALVRPSVQYKVATVAAGGEAFVGHTKRDHINFVHRLKSKAIEGGDAATLVNLLTKRQAEDPGFFFRVQFNEEGRLCHLFWCDSMMREDYRLYHDVLIFDTTYRTNRYNLICGAFVGINNHWSNVMFGCAFLSDEKEESFQWLFNVFNEAMGDDLRPVSIFTNQDKAMTNALESVYPQSRHRLCQWHIQQNAISHFGTLKHDRPFQNMFNQCLNGCFSETEFEATWRTMTTEYGLDNHPWFNRLYSLRTKWCTAFNNMYFSADILSSQRSESTNHAMGFQASKTTSVTEFFEFGLAMGTRASIVQSEDSTLLYRVHTGGNEGSSHHVTYDCGNHLTDCTCRKYQVMGVLCSHIIRVLHMHSVQEIPFAYIRRRWTKFAKTEVWNRLLPADMRRSAANEAVNWRRSMFTNVNNLITKSQDVKEARAIVENFYGTANAEVTALLQSIATDADNNTQPSEDRAVLDPVRCTMKGRSQRKKRALGSGFLPLDSTPLKLPFALIVNCEHILG
ncbi:protein FAR1-RELATED SEQUENCE 5-like [Silene latifolia]|uniref:protein FAR1-RELATED SEQUENCE 5-like n=1 Tax=Silene latifolia TaxID=37657 RepID=UPI003D788946